MTIKRIIIILKKLRRIMPENQWRVMYYRKEYKPGYYNGDVDYPEISMGMN